MDAVKRYFRSPAAVVGLFLLLIVIAMAASAGWLYPNDPLSLAGRPLVCLPRGAGIRAAFDASCGLDVSLEASSPAVVVDLVARGLGEGVVAESMAAGGPDVAADRCLPARPSGPVVSPARAWLMSLSERRRSWALPRGRLLWRSPRGPTSTTLPRAR